MRFLQTAFVAISLAVYPTVMAQQLQGQGSVQVISDDGITFRGCLDDVGAWSSNFCGGITIVGDGYLSTNHGYLTLTESLEITVTPDVADAAYWQATDYSSFGQPTRLVADGGIEQNGGGGPYWYGAADPEEEDVPLTALEADGDQRVILAWTQVN
ncbi:hypothetical protein CBS63078_10085 [Aspergillus niger]|uniref:Uncharacterized protein n=2 Tax=Aspergillus niger TaxID=5061 RepID=G3Y427_ASPNA|nr:hypothetical protein ASPNIDRAFT_44973 [Aspergillus niger ATCC 1015]KAI2889931.1 hypothetical protein CBS63078_10085 [Aspergillus niger]KAI2935673.1 hypothetical protein CBS147321_8865 [Aspergillus niger]KAI2953964.1 hypothetical protein CBS147323_10024 [Aspergillus niger]KAI2960591.1 hypothetical protein CBS147322_556 [Aspergillus niger]